MITTAAGSNERSSLNPLRPLTPECKRYKRQHRYYSLDQNKLLLGLMRFDVEKATTPVSELGGTLILPSRQSGSRSGGQQSRRGSFLYRNDSDFKQKPPSRTPSISSEMHGEDLIVTPFAQILASLRNVRNNFVTLSSSTNAKPTKPRNLSRGSSVTSESGEFASLSSSKLTSDTLDELDWCLEQLENIQTHRSVSDMASNKFRKMLNRELSQFAETSTAGPQISQFLFNTFMAKHEEYDISGGSGCAGPGKLSLLEEEGGGGEQLGRVLEGEGEETPRHHTQTTSSVVTNPSGSSSTACPPQTASMSTIPGIKSDLICEEMNEMESGASPLPEFGIEISNEDRLRQIMNSLDVWGLDLFQVAQFSDHHPLTVTAFTIIKKRNLLTGFNLDPHKLIRYFKSIERHYQTNPYHNSTHAADVTQSIHVLLASPALNHVFTALEELSAVIASAIHDVDHPGFTNQFLVNSGNELAIMYNDESVLEQHHLAVAFKLLQQQEAGAGGSGGDLFDSWCKKQRATLRKIIIDMVLATDMSKHMNLLADLKTMVETKKVAGSGVLLLDNYNDRIQVLQSMIHLADLSNPTKPIEYYKKWNIRVMEEYWRQGDMERQTGIEISPMCDRHNTSIEKAQIGFIDYIVHPLWETWAELVFPDAQHILDTLEENRDWYNSQISVPDSKHQSLSASKPSLDVNGTEPSSSISTAPRHLITPENSQDLPF